MSLGTQLYCTLYTGKYDYVIVAVNFHVRTHDVLEVSD